MCRPVRRFASAALLVLVLPAAAAGAKAPPPASAAPVAGAVEALVVGSLRWLWQAAVHLVTPAGDSGPEMDPDG